MSLGLPGSGIKFSLDHAFELKLRSHLLKLWLQLPKSYRTSWESHPEFPKLGRQTAFWKTNYFRWRQKLGPILFWPEDWYAVGGVIISQTAEASGDCVTGSLSFAYGGALHTLAFAWYHYHRFDVFARGLRRLSTTKAVEDFSFRFTGLAPGWQKGIVTIFNEAGGLIHTVQLPTVYISKG